MSELSKYTLLVVDDEAELRDAIAFDFQRKGFNVLQAGSGNEALEVLAKNLVHVVISDVRMPNGDGVYLLDKIKEKNTMIPVVLFITGYTDLSLEDAYDKGADAVFSKPFDRKALFEAVKNALNPFEEKYSRKFSRLDADIPVGLTMASAKTKTDARARNLGRGGMFVSSADVQGKAGEEVSFSIEGEFAGNFKITGRGMIRWIRKEAGADLPAGYGIEFLALDNACNTKFIELINGLKTKKFIPKN